MQERESEEWRYDPQKESEYHEDVCKKKIFNSAGDIVHHSHCKKFKTE